MKEPKNLDRCFVNGSRPTGKILVSWCENTKTYKAVRYFGNEQLTTLSTANRACEVRVMLGKAAASDKVRALAGRTKNKKNAIGVEPLLMSLEDFPGVAEKHRNRHVFHAYSKGNFSIFLLFGQHLSTIFYNFPHV